MRIYFGIALLAALLTLARSQERVYPINDKYMGSYIIMKTYLGIVALLILALAGADAQERSPPSFFNPLLYTRKK